MTGLLSDVRFALRTLGRSPLFTGVAILSLALGIGANTAIFTLLDQLILRLLPVKDPQQLVMIWARGPHIGNNNGSRASSYPMYQDYQQKADFFSHVFCRYYAALSIGTGNQTERVQAELVSGNYFDALGVKPALGRVFSPEEDDRVYKGHPVAVLSHDYWVNRFHADRGVVGRKILINNYPITIVGVSAAGFRGLDPSQSPQVRIPILMEALMVPGSDRTGDRRSQWIQMFARLKPGETPASARAKLQPIFGRILEFELTQPQLRDISPFMRDRFLKRTVRLEPAETGYSQVREQFSTGLIVLMCMVGLVLLIACANVANLLIARAVARRKEIAVRLAIGASRGQIVRQLLIESTVLALVGGLAGILLAYWITAGLLSLLPQGDAPVMLSPEPDIRILAFNLSVAAFTGLIFGLLPALQAARFEVWDTLKDAVGSVVGMGSSVRLRKFLVVVQVALSFLLLTGAGLFVQSLRNLEQARTGFEDISSLVTFQVEPALSGYTQEREKAFNSQLLDAIRGLPGVVSAGTATVSLLHGGEWDSTMGVEGHKAGDGEDMQAFMNSVSPGYFSTMGVRLLEGRDFDRRDSGEKWNVVVVNRAFAKHFFGDKSAVGRRVGFGDGPKSKLDMEIVGVVDDALYEGPREGVHRQAFVSDLQRPWRTSNTFYVRVNRDPRGMYAALRAEVKRLDSSMPVFDVKTLGGQLNETLFTERLIAALSAGFGGLATLLAAIGLYGVMAFVVARRTREIGLRVALGADAGSVIWLVMREVLLLVGIGLAIGGPAAYATGRLMSSSLINQLFGVKPADPAVAAFALALLAVVGCAAGFLPARRASRVDPLIALRYE